MAEESNEAVAYLRALKGSGSENASAAAPAREPSTSPSPISPETGAAAPQYKGAEKRRSQRYKCEGSVQMREINCDVHTWASFTDISMHGCYVEAQATYPVGTQLQLRLEVNEHKVETKGTVRVCYPYLGMGIAFVELSEENQNNLRQLLASITHPHFIMGPGIASTLPTAANRLDLPVITNPQAALQALFDFYRDRQMLMREDFLRVLRNSQSPQVKR
jgi:hypothetical protein